MPAFSLPSGRPKTVIVTGGAGGIGAQTIRSFHDQGCNVVIADLPFARSAAESIISSLSDPNRALFHETDITDWENMRSLFRTTKDRFGQVDIVIANAGLMESKGFFDFEEDESGELEEPKEAYKIVDVNLKGSMNSTEFSPLSVPRSLTFISSPNGNTLYGVKPTRC
jgi:NAD(P)-dependent dehydrogenase (short-subunit alcohol dehydrogenase family)